MAAFAPVAPKADGSAWVRTASLFQVAVDRMKAIFPADRIFVVTVASQAENLQEPVPGNSGGKLPAGADAARHRFGGWAGGGRAAPARSAGGDGDSGRGSPDSECDLFPRSCSKRLITLAEDGYLVTLGIRPTYPATGYGYIQRGEQLDGYPFLAYEVKQFQGKAR